MAAARGALYVRGLQQLPARRPLAVVDRPCGGERRERDRPRVSRRLLGSPRMEGPLCGARVDRAAVRDGARESLAARLHAAGPGTGPRFSRLARERKCGRAGGGRRQAGARPNRDRGATAARNDRRQGKRQRSRGKRPQEHGALRRARRQPARLRREGGRERGRASDARPCRSRAARRNGGECERRRERRCRLRHSRGIRGRDDGRRFRAEHRERRSSAGAGVAARSTACAIQR